MSTLPPERVKNASALVNLFRNIGGAFGLAILNTQITHQTAFHYGESAARIERARGGAEAMMAGLAERLAAQGASEPEAAARKMVAQMVHREAATLAFADAFTLIAVVCCLAGCAALAARPLPPGYPPQAFAEEAH